MEMPKGKIEITMLAPCGMNCMVCYRHCSHPNPCGGCLQSNEGKPTHCRTCQIKGCVESKKYGYCYECKEYPCQQIKRLDKNYQKRYHSSLIQNGLDVKEKGIIHFMKQQKITYTCLDCGGVISLHDAACSQCLKKREKERGDLHE